jgi:hypothetical protein
VASLRHVEVLVANGRLTPEVCREAGISEQTYYREEAPAAATECRDCRR